MDKKINSIIKTYEHLTKGVEKTAKSGIDGRAYGGIIRAGKGKMVENMAAEIIRIAWEELGQNPERLTIDRKKIKLPIKKDYVEKIKSPEIRQYILENIDKYHFPLGVDLHIFIDGKFVLAMECKAYTENAMLKRILVDFSLLHEIYPKADLILFQLESQLGGDYSELKEISFGSPSTHTLLSYFDIKLNIITLLGGERKVKKPIHKKQYYKPLEKEVIWQVIGCVKNILQKYAI
ncbi:restriction endonuclease [bacterium (Candidatus Gribaldobacteria) CG08_land_8_20_14_0_20_39_15]|uniref:Restriction endonuclease n=1 Tax=bacterium (Candidatus Gribaldobacteria) CG08_land_8_20_14_0_20_39_15 TaxID=2014273 RepID=A0A2M6XU65_9BACT|nr:MAG: restriction endonuclease [bacterium (Candidatus Gribaldobacteria) CG08_land_8_20_14_0_20_39_15]